MAKVNEPKKREGDQILLRFPEGSDLRDRLKKSAKDNGRKTVTAEIIYRLEQSFDAPLPKDASLSEIQDLAFRIEGRVQDLLRAVNSLKSSGE